ncbi:hypothetical protein Sfulv_56430 [Streptomyces fulvorobeus]|uniref:HTH lacI-type domain-containing protein n=1 Tax=Streptomyces fulvorobeus TaxID=284028 RepID=A0A7J0CEA0_9ACTN|nr:hypothetical protein Sfulv_56430 [Streptomyces fulvorobeus]
MLAGVSVRTVSNVVSNAAAVAPATRARVMAAVEELGYRPNLAARNLRQGRTGLIGVVVPEIHSPTSAHWRVSSSTRRRNGAGPSCWTGPEGGRCWNGACSTARRATGWTE